MTDSRLTTLDTSFTWFDRPGVAVQLGAVATFEAAPLLDDRGQLRLHDLQDRVAAGLGAFPRLRQRLAPVPLDLHRPQWVDDTGFDIAAHVEAVDLSGPDGEADDADLRALAERLHEQPLDPRRPLWHLCFATGLRGGRVGVVERAHHALVDGVSGVDVVAILLDLARDAAAPTPDDWEPAPVPDSADRLVDAVHDRIAEPLGAIVRAAGALGRPRRTLQRAGAVASTLTTMARDGLLAPRSSLNAPIGAERRFAWVKAPLADAVDAARKAEVTVNDVVLSAVAGGLRHLLLHRGEPLGPDVRVKVLVPVSVRADGERNALGNRVGALLTPLPVGIGDPERRLAAIAATTRDLKAGHEAGTVDRALRAADLLPAQLARGLVRKLEGQRFVNLVVTNVPGPKFPLYALGARMLEAFPVVPIAANLTVNVAVLSYDGALTITLNADRETCPDVDVLSEGIERSLDQLGIQASLVGAGTG